MSGRDPAPSPDGAGHPGLQLDDDPRGSARQWRVERVAWVAMAALLLAVAAGLFGRGGPLSTVAARSADGRVQVRYDRFVRSHSPDRLRIEVRAAGASTRVAIARDYLEAMDVESIVPPPLAAESTTDALELVFGSTPQATVVVALRLAPERLGPLAGWVEADGAGRVPIRQFVYP